MKLSRKPTSTEISKARKGGFKRKRPRKPKSTASLDSMNNWGERYNEWCKGVAGGCKDFDAKNSLRRQIRNV